MFSISLLSFYTYYTPYTKSFLSALYNDRAANPNETAVKTIGKTGLSDIVKSPTFACVRKISRKEVTTAALEDFIAKPTNKAIKLMLTMTTDFKIS